ncbi:flagellar hook-length control protein FliK [Aquamicrobium defluvii]|uniref:Flagellar hook-length control protein FliK n=1 Tax=Aquamicrobium defluvii TaxID=69279 RepID=A0A4R6YE25_9HYPH|nr:flagellar hook-length control protein FliK [Aquamicrobium defluvii]TDR34263.1 flagellar hook-length control protein FliK [Aquamicrobium defluvii]
MSITSILQVLTRTPSHPSPERQGRQEGVADFSNILDDKSDGQTEAGLAAGGKDAFHMHPIRQPGNMIARIGLDEGGGERIEGEAPLQAHHIAMQPLLKEGTPSPLNLPPTAAASTGEQEAASLPEGHGIQHGPASMIFPSSARPAESAALGVAKSDTIATGAVGWQANRDAGPDRPAGAETSSDPAAPEKAASATEVAELSFPQPRAQQGRDEPTPRISVVAMQSFAAPANTGLDLTVSSVVEALAGDEGLKQTAIAASSHGAGLHRIAGPAHSLRIELHPAELGMISARLLLAGDQLSVEIRPDTQEGWQRLSSDSETIARAMRDLGFEISRVTVLPPSATATPASRTDAGALAGRDGPALDAGGSGHEGGSQGERHASGNNAQENRQPLRSSPSASANSGGGLYI